MNLVSIQDYMIIQKIERFYMSKSGAIQKQTRHWKAAELLPRFQFGAVKFMQNKFFPFSQFAYGQTNFALPHKGIQLKSETQSRLLHRTREALHQREAGLISDSFTCCAPLTSHYKD